MHAQKYRFYNIHWRYGLAFMLLFPQAGGKELQFGSTLNLFSLVNSFMRNFQVRRSNIYFNGVMRK